MTTIIGLSGSLRKASYNTALLRAGTMLMPAGATLSIKTIHGFPVFNEDDEAIGTPEIILEMRAQIAAADGLLLATPEYNDSIPGPLKNAIDWLSRPGKAVPRVFFDKPLAIIGSTPGRMGTALAQAAWRPTLRAVGAKFWTGGHLEIAQVHKAFDSYGQLSDATLTESFRIFLAGFVQFSIGQLHRET